MACPRYIACVECVVCIPLSRRLQASKPHPPPIFDGSTNLLSRGSLLAASPCAAQVITAFLLNVLVLGLLCLVNAGIFVGIEGWAPGPTHPSRVHVWPKEGTGRHKGC